VKNQKFGNLAVFLWEEKNGCLFCAKNSHYANFQRNRRRSDWKIRPFLQRLICDNGFEEFLRFWGEKSSFVVQIESEIL
jgi:hypothetical protein